MPWSKLRFQPGIVKDVTRYSADGTWVDGSLVRFRNGYPERWGGWVRYLEDTELVGKCRSLHRWAVLIGFIYVGIGTNRRFYVASDDVITDVTPIASTAVVNNPFATTIGSTRVVVTDTAHGQFANNEVIFSGASAVGGVPAADFNQQHFVTEYISDNTYAIEVDTAATSTVAAGGGSVTMNYLFAAGSEDQLFGGGWGSGTWGESEWGGSGDGADVMGTWTQDNWGEDLVACAFDGPIFYWDATTPTARMVNIRALPGADGNAPTYARFITVSHRDRHLIAFGVGEEFGGSTYAPMTIRWCSQENILNWDEADTAGTAGSIPLSRGSRFMAIEPTQREILVWSDTSLYSLQFVGAPDVYVAEILSESSDIAGQNAAQSIGTSTYWMGRSGFYLYDGRVQKIPCPVWEYLQNGVNWAQGNKVYCGTNRTMDEVIWFYPSTDGIENDRYVSLDILNGTWATGILGRTAWLDMDFQYQPLAASSDNKMFFHETGMDDGSENPPIAISAYVESAPFELSSEGSYDKGDRMMFIRRILPDVTFIDNDGVNTPRMNIVLKTMDKPGGGFKTTSSSQVSQTAIIPVEEFTDDAHVRLRGRSLTIRLESDQLGSQWRIGTPRFDFRSDGQR